MSPDPPKDYIPKYGYEGQTGLGGTTPALDASLGGYDPSAMETAKQAQMVNLEEQQALNQHRSERALAPASNPNASLPDWLQQYMEAQPFTDPYHQTPVGGVDMVRKNKYLTDQEKLKYLKSLRDQGRDNGTR